MSVVSSSSGTVTRATAITTGWVPDGESSVAADGAPSVYTVNGGAAQDASITAATQHAAIGRDGFIAGVRSAAVVDHARSIVNLFKLQLTILPFQLTEVNQLPKRYENNAYNSHL